MRTQKRIEALNTLPSAMHQSIAHISQNILPLAKVLAEAQSVFFIGRHLLSPIAFEGALKMKELSYIHAEAYAAGELKHGSLALIDQTFPTVGLLSTHHLLDKTLGNLCEIASRDGPLLLIGDEAALDKASHLSDLRLAVPDIEKDLVPFMHTIGVQFLAYQTAILKGNDIDKPRNIAKSVTVE